MTNKKLRYDKFLELEIKKARIRGDFKTVFILGLELDKWKGFKLWY